MDNGPARWTTPPSGKLKINTDGAFNGLLVRMGMGGLIQNDAGEWTADFVAGSRGGSAFKAEILALKYGLLMAWSMDVHDIVCEFDCLEIMVALRDDRLHYHEDALDLWEVKQLLQRSWTVQLVAISRTANDAADCLATLGADRQCFVTRLEDPPSQL